MRRRFTCNACSGVSAFSQRGLVWSVLSGFGFILAVVASLRFWVSASPSGSISFGMLPGIIGFILFLVGYQIVSALTLRHLAHLIPVPPGDS